MVVVAGVVSTLSENSRRQEQAARATAARTQALYELNVELSNSRDAQQLAAVTARHLSKLFGVPVSVLLQTPEGTLQPAETARDRLLAQSAWTRREFVKQHAPSGTAIWVPVVGAHSSLGAVGLKPNVAVRAGLGAGLFALRLRESAGNGGGASAACRRGASHPAGGRGRATAQLLAERGFARSEDTLGHDDRRWRRVDWAHRRDRAQSSR